MIFSGVKILIALELPGKYNHLWFGYIIYDWFFLALDWNGLWFQTNDEILKELLDVIDFCERLKPTKIEGPTESLLCIIKKYKVLKKWR